jgi:hypothetical protein
MTAEEAAVRAEPAAQGEEPSPGEVRTAVVLVHGMREKRPLEALDGFVRTALDPQQAQGEAKWQYHSRPAVITGSYEARRYVSRQQDSDPTGPEQGDTEIYDYNWSFLMTSNRFAGLAPTAMRLFLRRPSNVPDPLFGMWRVVWIVLLAILLAVPALFVGGYLLSSDVPGSIIGLVSGAVVLLFWFGLLRFVVGALANSAVAAPLVGVARYLEPSPYSYAARRAIRGGLVGLLRDLHDGRYSRIIVVAHGVGAYISYDALSALWAETHELHAGPAPDVQTPLPIKLNSLDGLEKAADRLLADGNSVAELDHFQDRQFALWRDLRKQGNPWRISDFVTVGAPVALADLLVTRRGIVSGFKKSDLMDRRELFDGLVRRGALVRCPPRSETLPVEGDEHGQVNYRWHECEAREVLGSQSLFAVTRWTNLWFPVIRGGLHGDWFGGELRSLFGPGIRDIEVRGNQPERFKRGSAHTEYFSHPDKGDQGDVAWHLRRTLALQTSNPARTEGGPCCRTSVRPAASRSG